VSSPRIWILAVLLVTGIAGSCGYETGLRVADKHASIGVEIFGNESHERDIERPLHEQITRAVRDLTDAPLEDPSHAEVIIRGTLRQFRRRGGVRSEDNKLLETGVYIEAEASLIDRRSGRALGPPKVAGTWIGFVLDDQSNEAQARDRALRHVADQLVLDLFAPVD
jgi:hypothetical protein